MRSCFSSLRTENSSRPTGRPLSRAKADARGAAAVKAKNARRERESSGIIKQTISHTMLRKLIHTNPHAAPAILRLALGVVFFTHGAQKMLGWWGGYGFSATMSGFEHTGIPAVFAFLALAAAVFRGLGLILGLLGRVAAFEIGRAAARAER